MSVDVGTWCSVQNCQEPSAEGDHVCAGHRFGTAQVQTERSRRARKYGVMCEDFRVKLAAITDPRARQLLDLHCETASEYGEQPVSPEPATGLAYCHGCPGDSEYGFTRWVDCTTLPIVAGWFGIEIPRWPQ